MEEGESQDFKAKQSTGTAQDGCLYWTLSFSSFPFSQLVFAEDMSYCAALGGYFVGSWRPETAQKWEKAKRHLDGLASQKHAAF
jgi:hypothetical protein